MKNLQRLLQDVSNARRQELLPYVFDQCNARVQTGPFKGVVLIPNYMWGDGDTAAKLMGVYEDELHGFIETAIANSPDAVINVGCAEGYYSIGLASRLPGVTVTAVDIEPGSAKIVSDTAVANNLTNIKTVTKLVDCVWMQETFLSLTNPLVVLDCEGAELELLDLAQVPALAHCSILVECHDCITPGITNTLIERFQHTHLLQYAAQQRKDPFQFAWCATLSDCDKWALINEGRPSTMVWLYMVPKS